jgi:hypothetical protein
LKGQSYHNRGTGIIIASFELWVGFMAVGWFLDMVLMPGDFTFQITARDWKFNKYLGYTFFMCVFCSVVCN